MVVTMAILLKSGNGVTRATLVLESAQPGFHLELYRADDGDGGLLLPNINRVITMISSKRA